MTKCASSSPGVAHSTLAKGQNMGWRHNFPNQALSTWCVVPPQFFFGVNKEGQDSFFALSRGVVDLASADGQGLRNRRNGKWGLRISLSTNYIKCVVQY
jgi:hypothetical protein